MHFNLYLTYWGLLSIACMSSCFLFFVVASENVKHVSPIMELNAPQTADDVLTDTATDSSMSDSTSGQDALPTNQNQIRKDKVKLETENVLLTVPESLPQSHKPESNPSDVLHEPNVNHFAVLSKLTNVDSGANSETDAPGIFVFNEKKSSTTSIPQQVLILSTASSAHKESLPDVNEMPTVKGTDSSLDRLTPQNVNLEAAINTVAKESLEEQRNDTAAEISDDYNKAIYNDEKITKFNDSGGADIEGPTTTETNNKKTENISSEDWNALSDKDSTKTQNISNDDKPNTLNLTGEEVAIPVFSEWAQKQMEAAEKQQAKDQEVVNASAHKKTQTNGNGKFLPLKIRSKNYASPDCGAKIIASNADASNTGAVLSSSKDEYMLSQCGNRIWFVVELCEAIQAQKIELANFELFSSSPKNFSVAVSNRFPTRDWSNVGLFIAEDKRNIQSFELKPHLFGKFVRVDIFSHYSKEHFCPVSLFRVFGTSEFEAFETENHPNEDLDDFDEEFGFDQASVKNSEPNLFKSASDAVLSIVKKAAEVLAKPNNSQNDSLAVQTQTYGCCTPAFGAFNCADCSHLLVTRINNALSCELHQLDQLLHVELLRQDFLKTQICFKLYGIETGTMNAIGDEEEHCNASTALAQNSPSSIQEKDVKQSYYLHLLPSYYIGALCQLLANRNFYLLKSQNKNTSSEGDQFTDTALNLTIDKKPYNEDFDVKENTIKKIITPEPEIVPDSSLENIDLAKAKSDETAEQAPQKQEPQIATTDRSLPVDEQLPLPIEEEYLQDTTTKANSVEKETAPDVNIFNLPKEEKEKDVETVTEGRIEESSATSTTSMPPSTTEAVLTETPRTEDDSNGWESLEENLLTPTMSVTATTGGAVPTSNGNNNAVNSGNLQQKIPSGPQSESIFIRLSNRIKALERNMSLSGQYLEELSRRYKKQVEELQLTLNQQTQTVRALEEQSRRHIELEQLYAQRYIQLKYEVDDLSLQMHACIVVIIFVGAFVFLVLIVGILFCRARRRETKEILSFIATMYSTKKETHTVETAGTFQHKKLNRRKSFDDFSDKKQSSSGPDEKQRRPSEEAMLILKQSEDLDKITIEKVGDMPAANVERIHNENQVRQRKVSVCYGSNNNLINKRKGKKHSWPQVEKQKEAWSQLQEVENPKKETASDLTKNYNSKNDTSCNGHERKIGKVKKKYHHLKRQESGATSAAAPELEHSLQTISANTSANITDFSNSSSLSLFDGEDLDNFIPNSDLAYNEFMPEGPSGFQIVSDTANKIDKLPVSVGSNKKSRRLSSPIFFKSPFSKSLKTKAGNATSKLNVPHASTSWEWCHLKKADVQQQKQLKQPYSPDVPITDSNLSPLSYKNVDNPNCTDSSVRWQMRVLEETILNSNGSAKNIRNDATASTIDATPSNGYSGSSSNSGSSNRSSTSISSSKKKNRTFNRLFRKVF